MNNKFRGKDHQVQTKSRDQLDERKDVIAQKEYTNANFELIDAKHNIKAQDLKKVYGDGTAAVNGVSFSVKKGEVFGLLGPNGAGKSTSFNVMSFEFKRSEGEVKIMDIPIDELTISNHGHKMGLCPQHNTIWQHLTVDQSLKYIGEVKGLSDDEIEFQKKFVMRTLDLNPYINVKAKDLSGGNKRKLVCAMSLMACPQVEFMDEPTTGVDPVSRRSLFKMLKHLPECSLILTTHRMDEAESLCSNIAIMINGKFVVYGTPSYLKAEYGQGYMVSVSLKDNEDAVKSAMASDLSFLEFKDKLQTDVIELNY